MLPMYWAALRTEGRYDGSAAMACKEKRMSIDSDEELEGMERAGKATRAVLEAYAKCLRCLWRTNADARCDVRQPRKKAAPRMRNGLFMS